MNEKDKPIRVGLHVTLRRRGKKKIYQAEFHHNDRHRRKTMETRNKKVAMKKAIEIDHQLSNGTYDSSQRETQRSKTTMKTREAIKKFLNFLRTEGRRHKTVRRYDGILDTFATFAEGQGVFDLDRIDMTLIDEYRAHRAKSLKPKSMHNEASLIKSFLAWCKERDYIEKNPLEKRKFTPPKPDEKHAPAMPQVNKILAHASELRFAQYALLAFCGARSGEEQHLRIEDVALDGNWIHIRSRPGFETKSGEERKVPIHPRLRRILEALPRRRSGWFFTALPSKRYPKGDHHISTRRLNEDFKKLLKKLEMPVGRDGGFTIHSLRRFFRTRAVNSGVPERVVDIWLGHRDRKSMGSVYYDLSDEESQKFMEQVQFPEEDEE